MNTNNTPVEFPNNGGIYDPVAPGHDQNSSDSASSAIARVSRSANSTPRLKTPPERHSRKCAVCNHDDRESIEEAYLNWTSPERIASQFDLSSYASVYRHVEAVGLAASRRRRKHAALDLIIERAGHARVTGGDVIRAIITSARIGDDGEYIEPVRRTQINHNTTSGKPISNRKPKLLETP